MGWLTAAGCEIMWTEGKIILKHPIRGKIEIKVELGCPQVDRNLAMELIRELETGKLAKRAKAVDLVPEEVRPSEEDEGLVRWMEMLVQDHPVLSGLPLHIRERLVVQPGELKHLPANRHKRRRMKDGYLLHMYAGSADGFCLAKAFREVGLSSKILEVDVQRGSDQDLLKGPLYPALIRSALQGQILGVLGGRSCRTRSVLRHYPRPGYPRPVRSWASSQEFGLDDLTESERLMVQEDDILLWRQVFLYVVLDLVLKATKPGGVAHLLIEQPAAPRHVPECVSKRAQARARVRILLEDEGMERAEGGAQASRADLQPGRLSTRSGGGREANHSGRNTGIGTSSAAELSGEDTGRRRWRL